RMKLRVGVIQYSPKLGQVQANLRRVKELSDNIQPGSIDLLCLPEMALTGYNFESATAVTPFLEKPRTGITSTFCSDLAKRLGCFVTSGYPESLEPDEIRQCVLFDRVKIEDSDIWGKPSSKKRQIVGANSAILYGPQGEWVGGYRKSNLFWTDKTWAAAGSGFTSFKLPPPINNLTLAICMDLNPFTDGWRSDAGPYELADYCQTSKTNLLVLLNAWLDPGIEDDDEPSWKTLEYWVARLRPLWSKCKDSPDKDEHDPNKYTTFVVCNRTGEENGVAFAGSSASFHMDRERGKPRIVDMMTKEEEGLRIFNFDLPSS
ncbi:hypothetical protein AGABI2DRAFT_71992, partial [Agaricus bisporus var. bisporus H97]|uniref:hypothetical protein n=1 Tax=Agaricus bisporus var. bisporus (strain H97 / ATCC MYA-4626 / FGSC 10389) TaxID=936046 RepID=UPI00029F5926